MVGNDEQIAQVFVVENEFNFNTPLVDNTKPVAGKTDSRLQSVSALQAVAPVVPNGNVGQIRQVVAPVEG